jgi:hypothetical protein
MDTQFDVEQIMTDLDSDAHWFRPRPFAVFGVRTVDGSPFLGWGIELPEPRATVFYRPDAKLLWRGSSAEGILSHHELFGTARLVWLDD